VPGAAGRRVADPTPSRVTAGVVERVEPGRPPGLGPPVRTPAEDDEALLETLAELSALGRWKPAGGTAAVSKHTLQHFSALSGKRFTQAVARLPAAGRVKEVKVTAKGAGAGGRKGATGPVQVSRSDEGRRSRAGSSNLSSDLSGPTGANYGTHCSLLGGRQFGQEDSGQISPKGWG
jgi:hypothetical protein